MKIVRLFFLFFITFGIFVVSFFSFSFAKTAEKSESDYVCVLYFTAIGCPNCAVTDPQVLEEWPGEISNLVIIEYNWQTGDWGSPNLKFFSKYASAHRLQTAVPQLIINGNIIRLGRLDVPKGKNDIQQIKSNFCSLLKEDVPFENIDLNKLPGEPKIWANNRILIKKKGYWLLQWDGEKLSEDALGEKSIDDGLAKKLLFSHNLSKTIRGYRFEITNPEKAEFSGSRFPDYGYAPYKSFENAIKIEIIEHSTVVDLKKEGKERAPSGGEGTVSVPFLGEIKTENFSLPLISLILGLADGFNPCAFYVLTFLLASLIGLAGVRKKILLAGGVFIFFSALFYFIFMAVLLNVFKLGENISILTVIAGSVAVFAGLLNIKDYFAFQRGISLTLPKKYKNKFIERVKRLDLAKTTWALVAAVSVIACTVNIYELLCTFGFPVIFTRILTMRGLSPAAYYFYLFLYNIFYITPLLLITLIFAFTLGRKTFSKVWVKRFKLASGIMITLLGGVLICKPILLENIFTAFGTLAVSVLVSTAIIFIHSFFLNRKLSSDGN